MGLLTLASESVASAWSEASEEAKRDCRRYCDSHSECLKCDTNIGCGLGLKSMESFYRGGDRWFACKKTDYQIASEAHEHACKDFCAATNRCEKCSDVVGCGTTSLEVMKTWGGEGKNWYACQENLPSLGSLPSTAAVTDQHRTLIVSAGGFASSSGDDGLEWFCKDRFKGAPSVLCIGTWGQPGDNSETVSTKIVALADEMKRRSGVDPKIILIGKSMGGCKLHHAATGAEQASAGPLRARTVPLFIGIDMSCQVAKHWQANDPLKFTPNVTRIYNFIQPNGPTQTGHPAVREGASAEPAMSAGITTVQVTAQGLTTATSTVTATAMCPGVEHSSIDDCPNLLGAVPGFLRQTQMRSIS